MRFDFATAARLVFGVGRVSELPGIAREFGVRALLVCGKNPASFDQLRRGLEAANIHVIVHTTPGEPTIQMVRAGALLCVEHRRELVVGAGGGSAIDAAKAIAILATNSGEPLDYMEVVGRGRSFERPGLPFIAVPTTAGTGAEVTRNAVIGSPEHGVKASLRSPLMLAKVALIDPELTFSVPPEVTAYTGLDTLTQLIEPFVCARANPLVDTFCREGMARVRVSLVRAFDNSRDAEARTSMSFASLLSGLSLANAGLGVVHGFAGPLGGIIDAPHGAICAALLVEGVEANVRALRNREPSHPALQKYAEAAAILTRSDAATAEDLAPWLSELTGRLHVQRAGALGLTRDRIPELVEKASDASSMKANPIALSSAELTEVVERAL